MDPVRVFDGTNRSEHKESSVIMEIIYIYGDFMVRKLKKRKSLRKN